MNEYAKILQDFVPYDKNNIIELEKHFPTAIAIIGQMLSLNTEAITLWVTENTQEVLDFLDGNGFIEEIIEITIEGKSIGQQCCLKPQYFT